MPEWLDFISGAGTVGMLCSIVALQLLHVHPPRFLHGIGAGWHDMQLLHPHPHPRSLHGVGAGAHNRGNGAQPTCYAASDVAGIRRVRLPGEPALPYQLDPQIDRQRKQVGGCQHPDQHAGWVHWLTVFFF